MKSLPNLLIVDDAEVNLFLIENLIRKIKVNLIKALSGAEALEKTRGLELALAIIDVRMPVMDGYEFAVKLNEERENDKVPVIFLTANSINETEVFKGYNSGAVDYISKPFISNILLSKINIFLDLFNQKQKVISDAALLKESAKELKKVNTALKKSEGRLRDIMFSMADWVWEIDENGVYTYSSKKGAELLGVSHEEIIGKTPFDFMSPDEVRRAEEILSRIMANKAAIKDYESWNIGKNGEKICLLTNGVPIIDEHGNFKGYRGVDKDITVRKCAEAALLESEEKYRTMLNASPDGIFLIDFNGRITDVSEIGIELFGFDTKEELIGKHFLNFVPAEGKNPVRDIITKTMNEGIAQNIEMRIKKKNQSLFLSEACSTLIQGAEGKPFSFMIIIRDISFRKKMETKQIHADRMANLGEMASGIAHEINQPLNIISMVMDKILFETAKTETVDVDFLKAKSDKIFENIIRIRNIIDHVRAFSRSHDDYVLTAFDINNSIENATSMIIEQFKHLGISLSLNLDKRIPQIVGNTYKLEQVIVNLLTNAKDAVIEKKKKEEGFNDLKVSILTYQKNQNLIIEINDNGIGVENEDLHNIMLPFYTTKEEGKGTGLGLSICYQIIKEMNGTIDIASNKPYGTSIKLILDIQKEN